MVCHSCISAPAHDADDLADGIMAIADPDAKNLEGIKDNLKDIFGKKSGISYSKTNEVLFIKIIKNKLCQINISTEFFYLILTDLQH